MFQVLPPNVPLVLGITLRNPESAQPATTPTVRPSLLENATVCGRDWYKLLDAPVLTLDVTLRGDRSWESV